MAEPKTTWGNWTFDQETFVLRYAPHDYEIDLDECTDSAHILDWIFQIQEKTWAEDPKVMADLLTALNAILWPQRNYCSRGQNLTADPRQAASVRFAMTAALDEAERNRDK